MSEVAALKPTSLFPSDRPEVSPAGDAALLLCPVAGIGGLGWTGGGLPIGFESPGGIMAWTIHLPAWCGVVLLGVGFFAGWWWQRRLRAMPGRDEGAGSAGGGTRGDPEIDRRLEASQQELREVRAALDQHAIVAITDPQGRITDVNEKFCAISQYAREELLGQDHRIINSGHHPQAFFQELWSTIGRGRVWHGEIKNRAKDGSFYWVDTTIVPFLDEATGKPRQYVAIRADITPIKEAEVALRRQAEDLKRSNRDLEQFAYVASHDLQEPLRAVAGCLQVLQRRLEGRLDDRGQELVGHAVDGAARMQALIEGLLAFSRVGTRGGRLVRVACDEAVDLALKNLSVSIRETAATITRDPLPELAGDVQQLAQLFQNLIGNALKFHGEQAPRVHIGAERTEPGWVISVADNGIGIEPRYFDRIFAIFQRLHTRREYPGTGIGLALSKKIVERHGGTIDVHSVPGEGTTFRCLFPPPEGGPATVSGAGRATSSADTFPSDSISS